MVLYCIKNSTVLDHLLKQREKYIITRVSNIQATFRHCCVDALGPIDEWMAQSRLQWPFEMGPWSMYWLVESFPMGYHLCKKRREIWTHIFCDIYKYPLICTYIHWYFRWYFLNISWHININWHCIVVLYKIKSILYKLYRFSHGSQGS